MKGYILSLFIIASVTNGTQQWSNWGRPDSCEVDAVFEPCTVDEVKEIISQARKARKTVRFVGSRHSPLDVVATDGYIVKTDYFSRIIALDYDTFRVTVEGGIKLRALIHELENLGFSLPNHGMITEQSIAGATATGTHGSGPNATISEAIVAAEIIDGNGNHIIIDETHSTELLPMVRLNLGALGFVYRLTLQCEPLFILTHERHLSSWDHVSEQFIDHLAANDYVMYMGESSGDRVLVHTWNRHPHSSSCGNAQNHYGEPWLEWMITDPRMQDYSSFYVARYAPTLVSSFIPLFLWAQQRKSHVDLSSRTFCFKASKEPEDYFETECALPIRRFPIALKALKGLYERYRLEGKPVSGLIVVRFEAATSGVLLHPAHDRDTAYIDIATIGAMPYYSQFYVDFDTLMRLFGGRPHWGKLNAFSREAIDNAYGSRIHEFEMVRRQFDPEGVFANGYIKKYIMEP